MCKVLSWNGNIQAKTVNTSPSLSYLNVTLIYARGLMRLTAFSYMEITCISFSMRNRLNTKSGRIFFLRNSSTSLAKHWRSVREICNEEARSGARNVSELVFYSLCQMCPQYIERINGNAACRYLSLSLAIARSRRLSFIHSSRDWGGRGGGTK